MSSVSSEDQYDQLPDDIDYAQIGEEEWVVMQAQAHLPPQLGHPQLPSTPSQDPDLPLNTLSSPGTNVQQASGVSAENGHTQQDSHSAVSHTPSSAYFSEDDLELDEAFLNQLDVVENQLLNNGHTMTGGASTSSRAYTPSDKPNDCGVSTSPQGSCKRRFDSKSTDDLDAPKKRSKMEHGGNMTEILEGYEDDISCPICCDLLVGAQVVNPCGHTLCGDCGYQWIVKERHASCPVCRTKSRMSRPMLPNIIAENLVERHINVLALLGDSAWKKGGLKRVEWNTRKEKWLEECALRSHPPKITIKL